MSNPSKAKGTNAETAVVRYMRLNGYGGADRQPLRGNRDAGDINLTAGLVLEVKAHRGGPGFGQPSAHQLAAWMSQCSSEARNAGALMCPLIVKRSGTADVGQWYAYLPLVDLLRLAGVATGLGRPPDTAPVCMAVGPFVDFLRSAGYGDPRPVQP